MFLNGILTNTEIWYGLSSSEISELDELDRSLLRQILNTKISTPVESLFLELGCLDVETVIKSRRINYLHYLVTRDNAEMLSKFFHTQWKYPCNSKEWTEQVRVDLDDFEIPVDLNFIKSKSEFSFKNMVKVKAKEYCFMKMMEKKIGHSKMDDVFYTSLKIQKYLKSNKFTPTQARLIYSFRTRMADFQENFQGSQGHTPCPLCLVHSDSQALAFQCPKLKSEVELRGKYDDIFTEEIPLELVETLTKVMKYRDDFKQQRAVE